MGATISVFLFGGTRTKGHYPTKRVPLGHEAYGSLRAVRKGCVEAELGGLDARLAGRRNARSAHLVHVGLGMFVHGMRLCAATGPGRRRVRMTDESHMSCRTAPWPGREWSRLYGQSVAVPVTCRVSCGPRK